jgi:hypothetical protein
VPAATILVGSNRGSQNLISGKWGDDEPRYTMRVSTRLR